MAVVLTIDDLKSDELRWNNVIWKNADRIVSHLQTRIVKAAKVGNHKRVRSLHRFLTRSLSARLLAVKRITTNRGNDVVGCRMLSGILSRLEPCEGKLSRTVLMGNEGVSPLTYPIL